MSRSSLARLPTGWVSRGRSRTTPRRRSVRASGQAQGRWAVPAVMIGEWRDRRMGSRGLTAADSSTWIVSAPASRPLAPGPRRPLPIRRRAAHAQTRCCKNRAGRVGRVPRRMDGRRMDGQATRSSWRLNQSRSGEGPSSRGMVNEIASQEMTVSRVRQARRVAIIDEV